jgi:hypothetical protein
MTEVILLLFIGAVLIVLNVNAIKKEKKSFSGTLKDKENNMQDYEIEIGKIRRDLSETVLELQQEIEALKEEKKTNNLKEVRNEDNREDRGFYKNLYEGNSENDEKIISENLKSQDVEQRPTEIFIKELETVQNDKLNEKDKNEIEHKPINVIESVTESNVVEQNKEEAEKEPEKQNEESFNEKKDEKIIIEEKRGKNTNQNYRANNNQRKKTKQNKNYANKTNNSLNNYPKVDENNKRDEISKSNESSKSSGNNVKVNEIKTMLDEGLSIDEISEKIGIGKGEVLLIKELYIK